MSRNPALQAAQAKLLLDQLLAEPLLRSPTADELADAMARGDWTYAKMLFNRGTPALVMALPPEDRAKAAAHLNRIADRAEVGVARARSDWESLKAEAALLQATEAEERAAAAEKRVAEAEAMLRKAEVATEISAKLAELAAAAPRSPATPPPEPEPDLAKASGKPNAKPLWSNLVKGFIVEKTRVVEGHREYDDSTVRQTEATMFLWTQMLGDRPINDYDGADAGRFRDLMLRMPSSHGKSGTRAKVRQVITPLEAIRQADEKQKDIDSHNATLALDVPPLPSVPRLSMKTLKRHFSTLSQFWIYAGRLSHVPRENNPFRGWEYQGLKKVKKRGPWSADDLNRLLSSDWFDPDKAGTDRWWITLIAMWNGLRVEETMRLRPSLDIQVIAGVPSFVVQEHSAPSKWSPKTEAGERTVPIHSFLLDRGFMYFVERKREGGAARLFEPSVRASSGKLSAKFVSDFSRHKASLGVGPSTVLHSFRHNVSTILRNTKLQEARESWIDAILGHAGGEDELGQKRFQSEGEKTYLDGIYLRNLKITVEAIRYPETVDLSRLDSMYLAAGTET